MSIPANWKPLEVSTKYGDMIIFVVDETNFDG